MVQFTPLYSFERDLPVSLIAGDSKTFKYSNANYTDALGWSMTYILNGANRLEIEGSANGATFDFTIPANKTEHWEAQYAAYAIIATKGTDRKTLARGSIQIHANPANTDFGERIKQLEADLKAIRNIKSKLAKDPKLQMSFGGRTFSRANWQEIRVMETDIARELYILKHGHSNVRKTIRVTLG